MFMNGSVQAEKEQEEQQQESQIESYMEELDLQSVQEAVDELLPQDRLDVRTMITQMCRGNIPLSGETIGRLAESTLYSEIKKQRTTITQILILAVASSVFSVFMSAFTQSRVQ